MEDPVSILPRGRRTAATSAICGTDLHMVRGTLPGMEPGTVLGHEGVGVVEEVGADVRNLRPGDRVVIPLHYRLRLVLVLPGRLLRPVRPGQPQRARRGDGLLRRAGEHRALPTSWFGARLAQVGEGDTVAVFGAGVVGQLAMASAKMQGAGRVLAVDNHPSRLDRARMQGAEPVNYDQEDAVGTIKHLTGGIGVDRAIDAVGVDANRPHAGPAAAGAGDTAERVAAERARLAPKTAPSGGNWEPGDAPSQVLEWAVASLAKAGTLGVIGVYPVTATSFSIGAAMNKNLTVNMGNCNHRRYLPKLIDLVASGAVDLSPNLTQDEPLSGIVEAYRSFDRREPGWLKVKISA